VIQTHTSSIQTEVVTTALRQMSHSSAHSHCVCPHRGGVRKMQRKLMNTRGSFISSNTNIRGVMFRNELQKSFNIEKINTYDLYYKYSKRHTKFCLNYVGIKAFD
jgi:hypothetical protein